MPAADVGKLRREIAALQRENLRLRTELRAMKLERSAPAATEDEILKKAVGMTRDDLAAMLKKHELSSRTVSSSSDGEYVEWGVEANGQWLVTSYTTVIEGGKVVSINRVRNGGPVFREASGGRIPAR
jgi:hypothetical protein